jgi:hypothetical protein
MNVNFLLLGKIIKRNDEFISKQQQFILLYHFVKLHH